MSQTHEYKLPGGELWSSQYGEDHIGAAKIRREFLRQTIDYRDIYEETFDALRLNGRETILDAGCNDADDELNLRIERGHLGPLIAMDVPPAELTLAGVQEDSRFVMAQEIIKANEQEINNIHFLYGYLQAIPLADRSVDRTMALWSMFHVPEAELPVAIGELSRVTRDMGIVAIGTNAFGHTQRKHRVLAEMGQILDIITPQPFSNNFKLEHVPHLVEASSDLIHLPQKSIFQESQLPIDAHSLSFFEAMIDSYLSSSQPVPTASEWKAALRQTPEYQRILAEIEQAGVAYETVRRGVEFFVKPRL